MVIFLAGFTSCKESPDQPTGSARKERLILIYAVAANNLESNLGADMREILKVAPNLNLINNAVVVYSVDNTGECTLKELQKDNKTGSYSFKTVNTFPEIPLSTSEERIFDVIDYVNTNYDYPYKGLVLWSHADGWIPWYQGSTPSFSKRKSFGWDNYGGNTYKTNITALAEAIPSGVFDFIWFDCCYMANIETVYQLRDKASYIAGYVTEIASDGMPYHLTMPYLLQKEPNLQQAAFEIYKYYDEAFVAVSVSVMDTENIELLADASGNILRNGTPPSSLSSIQNYERNLAVRFYDMKQLLDSYDNVKDEFKQELDQAFDEVVICKYISRFDFNHRPINVADYSGLSMHYYTPGGTYAEFYEYLDWFKATR